VDLDGGGAVVLPQRLQKSVDTSVAVLVVVE
jgi:hypothetical protein